MQKSIEKFVSPRTVATTNKDVIVKKIEGIYIEKFRNIQDDYIELSDKITLFSGHNGTMKTTLMGLFVQPFNSDKNDTFNAELKTKFSEIFKLSKFHDKERYRYNILIQDNDDKNIKIPVYTKPRSSKDPSIRIVTGGNTKNDGNLLFDTNFLSMNRLISIHGLNVSPIDITLSDDENKFISNFLNRVLLRDTYNEFEAVSDDLLKKTFGPTNSNYNYEAISSGEDNLGRIANSLISFMRIADSSDNSTTYNGLLCIDEMEASLHPVAQLNLFDFLYQWSSRYKVQIIANTHSLSLLRHAITQHGKGREINTYYLSTLYTENVHVIKNPEYELIYKEQTFDYNDKKVDIPKIDIICEDKVAILFLRRIVSKNEILRRINFIDHDKGEGLPVSFLVKLCNSASSFISNTIIIFDADVDDKQLNKIKKKENILRLPDKEAGLPIEKLIVKYLIEKDKDDDIYKSILMVPKEAIKRSLLQSRINITKLSDIDLIETSKFKHWFNKNRHYVDRIFNIFAKNVNGREEFVDELINKMNKICEKNGYPLLEK